MPRVAGSPEAALSEWKGGVTVAFDLVCGCATVDCKSLLARFAAREDVPMLSDVVRMLDKSTFQRSVYAGNAVETLQVGTGWRSSSRLSRSLH